MIESRSALTEQKRCECPRCPRCGEHPEVWAPPTAAIAMGADFRLVVCRAGECGTWLLLKDGGALRRFYPRDLGNIPKRFGVGQVAAQWVAFVVGIALAGQIHEGRGPFGTGKRSVGNA